MLYRLVTPLKVLFTKIVHGHINVYQLQYLEFGYLPVLPFFATSGVIFLKNQNLRTLPVWLRDLLSS